MRKSVLFLYFVGLFSFCCNAQNIIQISNNGKENNNQQQECPFRISGICSSEDIGGVSIEETEFRNERGTSWSAYGATNHNPFPVTVLILASCSSRSNDYEEVITIVLKPNETKELKGPWNSYTYNQKFQTIHEDWEECSYPLRRICNPPQFDIRICNPPTTQGLHLLYASLVFIFPIIFLKSTKYLH